MQTHSKFAGVLRRRRFRFGMKGVLRIVTLCACVAALVGWYTNRMSDLERLELVVSEYGGSVSLESYAPESLQKVDITKDALSRVTVSVPERFWRRCVDDLRDFPLVHKLRIQSHAGLSVAEEEELRRQVQDILPGIFVESTAGSGMQLTLNSHAYERLSQLINDPANRQRCGQINIAKLAARANSIEGAPICTSARRQVDGKSLEAWCISTYSPTMPGSFQSTVLLFADGEICDIKSYSGLTYWAMSFPEIDDFDGDGAPDIVVYADSGYFGYFAGLKHRPEDPPTRETEYFFDVLTLTPHGLMPLPLTTLTKDVYYSPTNDPNYRQ